MIRDELGLVIWGYQHHYRVVAESQAESVFGALDPSLLARVLLIGIPTPGDDPPDHIALDPLRCGYSEAHFHRIHSLAESIRAADPERRSFHSHPLAQEWHDERLRRRSYSKAIERLLGEFDGDLGLRSFVGYPQIISGHFVFVVVQFYASAYDTCPAFKLSTVHDHYPVTTSLVEAALDQYFRACFHELDRSDPGADLSDGWPSPREALRKAGKSLMARVAAMTGGDPESMDALFDEVSIIANLKYESKEGLGTLICSRREHPNIRVELRLAHPIPMSNNRAVRKLLEVSSEKMSLLSDAADIYGLGTIAGDYAGEREDLYEVHFKGSRRWLLKHAGQIIMQVSDEKPTLPKDPLDLDKLRDMLQRLFGSISHDDLEAVVKLAQEATTQGHGTILVVAANAKDEVERLEGEGIELEPVKLTPPLLHEVSSIDGAVVVDPTGKCYGIGVILDGRAGKGGDRSRGARFNSANRYVKSNPGMCIALVVSEDGMINMIPDLRRRIPRDWIPGLLDKLEEIARSAVRWREYHEVMDNLRNLSFYLSPEDCARANSMWHAIDQKIVLGIDTNFKRVYDDFTPMGEVDESYFLD